MYRVASKASNLIQTDDGETITFFVGGKVFRVFCFLLVSTISDTRYRRDETGIFNEDENGHGARVRWMKSSFPRLSWLRIISVSVSEG